MCTTTIKQKLDIPFITKFLGAYCSSEFSMSIAVLRNLNHYPSTFKTLSPPEHLCLSPSAWNAPLLFEQSIFPHTCLIKISISLADLVASYHRFGLWFKIDFSTINRQTLLLFSKCLNLCETENVLELKLNLPKLHSPLLMNMLKFLFHIFESNSILSRLRKRETISDKATKI